MHDFDKLMGTLSSEPEQPWILYLSEERYHQIIKALDHAHKRAGTIAQKERAQIKRLHREQAKRRRKLEEHFRKK